MTEEALRELSLFSGAGGGLLASLLLGWRPVGYVEWDAYCQRVLAARIADGYLPAAPIFTDVREFVQSGAAAEYRGIADVVSGGFPCQPFSVAGKRAGADDARNMWPATIECIRAVRPRYAFLENVPGLVTSGYFGAILGDLAESGYDVRWRVLSAAELGAPHIRKRLWVLAYPCAHLADANSGRCEQCAAQERGLRESDSRSPEVAHAHKLDGELHQPGVQREIQQRADAPRSSWWEAEPAMDRVVNGMADRVGQLRALGNGQVPIVAATAWRLLTEEA